MKSSVSIIVQEALLLLKELIAASSFSTQEDQTASILTKFLGSKGIEHYRAGNNVYARNKFYKEGIPTLLLNSHHDTVKPNKSYTRDPFTPIEQDGKLFGLGSNDAGGALVSLIAAFLHYYENPQLKYNLILAATAEEEISGTQGIESILPLLGRIDCAIVGEPTLMELAIAERGLMVLDCTSKGKAGHAAREEGDNAIYRALKDIEWFKIFQFPRLSNMLGPVKMSVTVIQSENNAHNVIPDTCRFVVDVRVNEHYTFEDLLGIIAAHVNCEIKPRSTRLRSSLIDPNHPLVRAGILSGKKTYGSPTTSDKALMPFPALKMGPGDSARSHIADEFIYIREIEEGIGTYIQLLNIVLNETVE